MIETRYISPSLLHRCTLELRDHRLGEASLFPIFDTRPMAAFGKTRGKSGGTIHYWLLVWTASPWIVLLEADQHVFERSAMGRPRIDLSYFELRDLARSDLPSFEGLWHWDPWWRLTERRYQLHHAVPALKGTNAVRHADGLFGRWLGAPYFSADLMTLLKAPRHLPATRHATIRPLADRQRSKPGRDAPFRVGSRWVLADRIAGRGWAKLHR